MKSPVSATVASVLPVIPGEPVVVRQRKVPLGATFAGTAFLAVLVPVYWHSYGPTNCLWFCEAALILTVAGMWLEKFQRPAAAKLGEPNRVCVFVAGRAVARRLPPHPPGPAQTLRRAAASDQGMAANSALQAISA